jgi:hypothetical protein
MKTKEKNTRMIGTTDYTKRVMIATPCAYGQVNMEYVSSLTETIKLAELNKIGIYPVFIGNDALIQRCRNDLVKIAIESNVDAMIFIDADMEWHPSWVMSLINREEDVIGGTARKKTDSEELYAVKISDTTILDNGLVKCDGIGTGFLKLSAKAITALWEASEPYNTERGECRMVFDVRIINGEMHSEDIIVTAKLKSAGFDIWLDPNMTCGHIGTKKFYGDILSFLNKINLFK